jgi:hypothetical protein
VLISIATLVGAAGTIKVHILASEGDRTPPMYGVIFTYVIIADVVNT